jgi:hypothetical protein
MPNILWQKAMSCDVPKMALTFRESQQRVVLIMKINLNPFPFLKLLLEVKFS